jgi:PhnB protein
MEMMLKVADSPVPEAKTKADADKIMHACVVVEGRNLMASDWMSEDPYPGKKGISLSLVYPTVDEAKRKFNALGEGGKVNMPMEKTFWVESFGMLVDRYGTSWMVSGGKQFT